MERSPSEGPCWLPQFLTGNYFSTCNRHISARTERNHFCIDCVHDGPVCQSGLHLEHDTHRSLQVRRASHQDCVRVSDIEQLANISGIQTYVINGAKIVFLLSRPQERIAKGATHWCKSCKRTLSDPTEFCSISCKLSAARSNASVSLALPYRPEQNSRSPSSRPKTCELQNEPVLVKLRAEDLTEEQKLSKAGKKLPVKKRKVASRIPDYELGRRSPVTVLLPGSPQHSANSHSCLSSLELPSPQYTNGSQVASPPRKHRRKGIPVRSHVQ